MQSATCNTVLYIPESDSSSVSSASWWSSFTVNRWRCKCPGPFQTCRRPYWVLKFLHCSGLALAAVSIWKSAYFVCLYFCPPTLSNIWKKHKNLSFKNILLSQSFHNNIFYKKPHIFPSILIMYVVRFFPKYLENSKIL